MTHKLLWSRTWDDDDNSIWEASGPYSDGDGGCLADWRLVNKLVADKAVWRAEHDADLQYEETANGEWQNLESAKSDVERVHNEILEENKKDDRDSNL